MADKTLEERLEAHPELKAKIEALVEVVESGIERADEVEERTVDLVRHVGRQVMQEWAERQEQEKAQSARDAMGSKLSSKGKKNSTGPRRSERSGSRSRCSR